MVNHDKKVNTAFNKAVKVIQANAIIGEFETSLYIPDAIANDVKNKLIKNIANIKFITCEQLPQVNKPQLSLFQAENTNEWHYRIKVI